MTLSHFAVRSPTKVTMLFLGVILLGWISLKRLPINLFPDLRQPSVTVFLTTKGLSPEEVERRVTLRLERSLVTIRNVRDVTTYSRDASAVGVVEFEWGTDMDFALLDVKKAAAEMSNIDEVEDVTVYRYDPNELPILTLAISGKDAQLDELYLLAFESLKPELERLEGVAAARITGGLQLEVLIALDENMLSHYGLDVQQVASAVQRATVNASGGYVEMGSERLLLKAVGEVESLDELELTAVGYRGGNPILLRDVAKVQVANKEIESIVRFNGVPGVGVSIHKEADANTPLVVDTVQEALKEYNKTLPKGVKIEIAYDQSTFVRTAITELRNEALMGVVLAVGVLLLFLRSITSTLIIATAIPISMIATFALMYFQGLSLNIMTLGGLALGSGMLVDCAIVVLESIFSHRQDGKGPEEAAISGAREVEAAIVASTLTTVVVFLPLVFVRGVAGYLFKEQALTVTYSLMASMMAALLLIPMLCSRFLVVRKKKVQLAGRTFYGRFLGLALDHPIVVFAITGVLLAATVALFPRIPKEFIPKSEERQFLIQVEMPAGTRIEVTNKAVEEIERMLEPYRDKIAKLYSRSGVSPEDLVTGGEEIQGPHTAEISVALTEPSSQSMKASELVAAVGPQIAKIPGLKAKYLLQQSSVSEIIGSSGAAIEIEVRGENLAQLTAATGQVRDALAAVPNLYNVRSNLMEGTPEVILDPNPLLMANFGLDAQTLANIMRSRLIGDDVSVFKSERGDLDIRVASKQVRERGLEHLSTMRIRTRNGTEATLGDLGQIRITRGPREVIRRDQKRINRVLADIKTGKLSDAVAAVKDVLSTLDPPGVTVQFSGEEQRRVESFKSLGLAFALAVVLVYMVIAAILESLIHPLTIMLTVPLGAIGVVFSLVLTGETMNLMAYIGIVVLAGIVVDNAIVLLDYVAQLRARGLGVREALMKGGQRRLRPILMTTLATTLALVPLAFGVGEGSELRRPLAVTVIGGMASSTMLTLVFIPVIYNLIENVLDWIRGLWRRYVRGENGCAVSLPSSDTN
jgi:HAE1 family hydrophobic/amphiphilic exporter-1